METDAAAHDVHRDRNDLEVIGVDECLELLGEFVIGRLAVEATGRPRIFPVNYVMDGNSIVFRTSAGTKLSEACHERFVAFEIDEADRQMHTGWSVVVSGVAHHVTDPAEVERLSVLPLRPWGPGHKDHFVRVTPVQVSGRRITPTPRDVHLP